jgi:hypothetical protein
MESWRVVWREGIAPVLSLAGLEALREALATDDPRLRQGFTTEPECPAFIDHNLDDRAPEAACGLGLAGWLGDRLETVGQVEEYFARCCMEGDQLLGEAAGTRWFLNWFDDTPRDEMRRELLPEVERSIRLRVTPPAKRTAGMTLAVAEAF